MANFRYNPLTATATSGWRAYQQVYNETTAFDWPVQDYTYDPTIGLFGNNGSGSVTGGWSDSLVVSTVEVTLDIVHTSFANTVSITVYDAAYNELGSVADYVVVAGSNVIVIDIITAGDIAHVIINDFTNEASVVRLNAITGGSTPIQWLPTFFVM